MSKSYRVAILGATGAVGKELLELLESRNFPIADLKLLASSRSACLLYTSPSPRDMRRSRMPSSA